MIVWLFWEAFQLFNLSTISSWYIVFEYGCSFVAKLTWKKNFFFSKKYIFFTKYTLFAEKMFLYRKKSVFILGNVEGRRRGT